MTTTWIVTPKRRVSRLPRGSLLDQREAILAMEYEVASRLCHGPWRSVSCVHEAHPPSYYVRRAALAAGVAANAGGLDPWRSLVVAA